MDPRSASGGSQNPSNIISGHGCFNMMSTENVVTRAKDYGTSQPDLGKEPAPPESPLPIDKPSDKPEIPPHIPKRFLKRLGHNPNARAVQNYSIFEHLGQIPCVMSVLEVLQTCPMQRKYLLSALGVVDGNSPIVIKFKTHGV